MIRKKSGFIIFFLLITSLFLKADEQLAELISQKQWDDLSKHFLDDSHLVLQNYFSDSLNIKFVTYNINKLTYKAKFKEYGEIGTITYEKKRGKYFQAKIKNQIKPLIFIENFQRYRIQNIRINIGDAKIFFSDGYLYLSSPFDQALFFIGQWEFSILPSDSEEQMTLRQLYRDNQITLFNNWGIFILTNKNFLEGIPWETHIFTGDSPVAPLVDIYRTFFGIQIKQLEEFWYLPFKGDDNLIVFQKDKKSFYLYDFNENLIPDTRLRVSENNQVILNYNALQGAKLRLQKTDKIDKISLNLFYNPASGFLSGTAILNFKHPESFRILNLNEDLKIKASLDQEQRGLSVIRKGEVYYFLGSDTSNHSFFYQGVILSETEPAEIYRKQILKIETSESGKLFFLSSSQHFYPHTDIDFTESKVTISLPREFNCLASGQLRKFNQTSRNVFQFDSPATKGISLACGQFQRLTTLKSKIPIHIFTSGKGITSKHFHVDSSADAIKKRKGPGEAASKYFDFKVLRESFNFLIDTYGRLDLTEINLLLRKDIQEGGSSNKGFIFFHYNPDKSFSQKITRSSPIIFSPDPTHHLIHELAHQWWGGILSWSSFEDAWITEGFAQFSLLYYLEKRLSEKSFTRLLKRIKKGIFEANHFGPVIYGKRIITIHDDYDTYQNIVYNKSAFILLMLREMIGEKEFRKRVQNVLQKFQYQSITTREFIQEFSRENNLVYQFLNHWIYKRKIPEITFDVSIKDNRADIDFNQRETDATFPLILRIKTKKETFFHTLTIIQKEQHFSLEAKSPIHSIEVDESKSLVEVRR